MIGAIAGDIIGSRFERRNHKSRDFTLFAPGCRPTDDSVMSLAVAGAVLESLDRGEDLSRLAVRWMQELGRRYPNAGYGGRFISWLWEDDPQPYGSYGNGSAMRVSPCGFAARSLDEAIALADRVTVVSHNHPEGVKGAEAIAAAVFLAREGRSKAEIRAYIGENSYPLDFTIDGIRERYAFDVSCQGSVPVALEAFLESSDFADAIRTAVSVGGDSDTIACMAGSVAEAYYGVPEDIVLRVADCLDRRETEILLAFEKRFPSRICGSGLTVYDVLSAAAEGKKPGHAPAQVDGAQ